MSEAATPFPLNFVLFWLRQHKRFARMYALCPTAVDFGKKWDELEHSVLRIMRLESIKPRQWDYNFSDIYALCVAVPEPYPEKLYDAVKKCLEMHVDGLYDVLAKAPPGDLLNEYNRLWNTFFGGTTYLHNLFGYLNKHHISGGFNLDEDYTYETEKKMEIGSLALHIWHEKLIKPNQQKIVDELLGAILADRKGQTTQQVDVVHGVIHSFVQVEEFGKEKIRNQNRIELTFNELNKGPDVQVYHTVFETKFLDATTEYYTQVASELLSRLKISEYMERVIKLIEEEDGRSRRYLHAASYSTVRKLCTELMVEKHKDCLNAECSHMVHNEQTADLRNMYQLMRVLPNGLSVMLKEFEGYVKKTGLEAIANLNGDNIPAQFVQNVLKVHTKFTKMVTDVFSDDGDFVGALDKALQSVVNDKEGGKTSRASERLSRYIDSLLRKSKNTVVETDLDTMLTNTIIIFRYIEDKDVFQKFYSKMLSSRLIHGVSQSMDAEESMIAKLKQACGYEFTSKLSRMFTDVGLSRDLTDRFNKNLETTNVKLDMQMNTLVLQAGAWPLQAPSSFTGEQSSSQAKNANHSAIPLVVVPPEFQTCVDHFEKFYSVSHNGRKLTWLYHMATVEVKLTYLDKPYTVTMSIQQLSIINCFASADSMTVAKIAEVTGITEDLLVKTLRTLIDANILSVPAKDDVRMETEVLLNLNMSSKRLKFKLPAPQLQKQVEKESEQVNNTVQQDRKYYMECTIVRIMKTRKVLKHTQLVNEVIEQTKARFTPDVNFIKKNIEALIEKMYIQRTDQNDEYQYLA
ncbi:hypothetical protein L596_022929 [Steinernema carpocapsae]|uniref:Cullin-2 n=2 Tax=Steinernema carpocapsae TaxID=34508 RepID=A0A4U5MC35_STECR|nr:hypothetical protein L596_022929 [Steinernema carpocapsae]